MTYREAYDALIAAKPDHILRRLLTNESAGNRVILDAELRKLGVAAAAPGAMRPAATFVEVENEAPDDPEDDVLTRLRVNQSDLFTERRRLSNTFHDCDTDGERAVVSRNIQKVQRQIEFVMRQIADYKEHGRIPGQDEKYPVPDDPFALVSLRNSLRASISRKSKEIRLLGEDVANEVPVAAEKLQRAETKFSELQNHLTRVQKAVEDRNIQPRGLQEG